jgi:hypothetical protein
MIRDGSITIMAENAETQWEPLSSQPAIKFMAGQSKLRSLCVTTPIDQDGLH